MQKIVGSIFLFALLYAGACSSPPVPPSTPESSARTEPALQLPAHRLNDVWKQGQSIWLFLVVDSRLSAEDAHRLTEHYNLQYSDAKILNIDMFCDDMYASHAFVSPARGSISDSEFYSHVL
jgi:hypothetical protein